MIDLDNNTDYEADIAGFEKILDITATGKNVELILVDDAEIKKLNAQYRNLDKPTDVLSFPIKESKTDFIGSIVISVDTAKRVADELGHPLEEELKILFIHGLLHTMGFDHETDNGQMREAEAEIAKKIGIKESMLAR